MVLAAGRGTRLGSLTEELPKPMLDVRGRPIIEWIARHLAASGIARVGVNLHYRGELIRAHLGTGAELGLAEVRYFEEPELLGTAGSVVNAAEFLVAEGAFLVQYADVVTDFPVRSLIAAHGVGQAAATIVVHRRPRSNSVAVIDADWRVQRFLERPGEAERRGVDSDWAFSGICVLGPSALERLPTGFSDLPADLFTGLAADGALRAVPLEGGRVAVDSAERLEELRALIAAGEIRPG